MTYQSIQSSCSTNNAATDVGAGHLLTLLHMELRVQILSPRRGRLVSLSTRVSVFKNELTLSRALFAVFGEFGFERRLDGKRSGREKTISMNHNYRAYVQRSHLCLAAAPFSNDHIVLSLSLSLFFFRAFALVFVLTR